MYDRKTKEELNQLSLEVFGSTSRWRKLVERGVSELVLEDSTRLKSDGTKEIVKTPLMHEGPNGGQIPQHRLIRYTVESIKEKMISLKQQKEQILDSIKKQQEEKIVNEKTKNIIQNATGSSV